ncbi:MBL fold metallo-hydrolase [Nitratireductor mangrovi]|uniref:MBL fold metallo-hydrolase n=1 Tax=Nitratireductor mangrovi TaxID=2599600 RepID=A0A5B8KUU3_9HYPH|nr:MBL fold metallo-hydrolase [Nitratireductor mangrovi]QDY99362.1 MBL fold metallo-hydrolase [Nitratireductor mangrovi]
MTTLDARELIDFLSRRRFLAGSAALIATPLLPTSAFALLEKRHSFTQGDFEITVMSDGDLRLPMNVLAPDATPEQLSEIAKEMGWAEMAQPATNIPLIKAGDDLVLVDNGSGGKFQPDTTGQLAQNLANAGIDPASITKVVFTHAHPDHVWGTLGDGDALAFPNAAYFVGAAEWDFWMNPEIFNQLPEEMHGFAKGAQRDLAAVEGRVTMVRAGDEIVSGISVLETPGHTPGHISLEVAGGDGLIITGDVTPNEIVSIEHPDWKFGFDAIPDLAIQTRQALVDRAATDKIKLLGYHFSYPGVGMVEKDGAGHRFVAAM